MNHLAHNITPGFLLRFTLPSIVMMVFNAFYTIVDGGFVSNFVGTGALSAVNIVYPTQSLTLAIGIMLATGGSAVCARQMGQGDDQGAKHSFSLLLFCGAAIGLLMAVVGTVFAGPIVRLLGSNDAIFQYCYDYMFYLSLFVPFAILQVMFQFFFTTAGRPGLGLAATLLGGVANIVFDYILIVPANLGIKGAAIATGIGFVLPSVMGLLYFSFNRKGHLCLVKPVLNLQILGESCINGSSEMVSNLATAITTLLFNLVMMNLLGEDGVAAITIIFYAQFLFTAVFFGFTSGVAPLVSFNYGAENHTRLQKLYRLSLIFVGICSALAFGGSLLLKGTVIRAFAKPGTAVYALAEEGMTLFAIGFLFMGFNIFVSGFFTALSNGRVSAILSFLRTLVFIVAAILLLPLLLGINGVWLSIPFAELLAAGVSAFYLAKLKPNYNY
ncbi:MATE family efflux transporter [Phocea massiliensis]|jgi:putative MATE family efflux protein|uniref:Multidrug export protein MepA n=1 Tax=uncultured Anaerotruncus sp. TaxID=905011 RepID=A0A6N2S7H3_9FIRM|nr:MATE family efflux transporter [Merdimmobilis hominis]MCD4836397.1 MATE family efflux transporter [Merdimmobilis hominis]PWL58226.1 MAG: MATE family efflux transporter [Oscillospiraceae bacterium]